MDNLKKILAYAKENISSFKKISVSSNEIYVFNFEDTCRLPDKRHREQLILNFEMKHVNKYGDNGIKPYR